MRILVDTNILFSALLFPLSKPAKALQKASDEHSVVLCDQNVNELKEILRRKAPKALPDAEVFLAEFQYELIPAVDDAGSGMLQISLFSMLQSYLMLI